MSKSIWSALCITFFYAGCALNAQQISFEWLKKYDGQQNTFSAEGGSDFLAIDANQNVYQVIEFQRWLGLGDTTFYESNDVVGQCLVKYNATGKLQWVRKIVGASENTKLIYWGKISSLQVANDGTIFICGEYSADYLHLGVGDTLESGCDECTTIFSATYSSQGDLIRVEQYRAKGGNEIETEGAVAFNPIMAIDARNHQLLSFLVYADTLAIGQRNLHYLEPSLAVVELDGNNRYIRDLRLTVGGDGLFYPSRLVPQKENAFLLFGYIDPEVSLSNSNGFEFESLPTSTQESSSFLLIQYNESGVPRYAKELHGEYLGAQLVADSLGNAYLYGYFDHFLQWGGSTLWNAAGENIGFIIKLDTNGEVIWQKIYPNAGVDVYLHNTPACIAPDGGFLAPFSMITPSETDSIIFEGHEVWPSFYDYASALVHFSPSGMLDTFIDLHSSNGLIFALSLNYDPHGRLYGVFQTAGMDTLNIGAYTFSVVEQTSEIIGSFTLSNFPNFTAPRAIRNASKNAKNLNIVKTYPNPVEQQLTIEWEPQAQSSELILYNSQGKALHKTQLPPQTQQHQLDLSIWPAGLYILEWRCGALLESKRVLKIGTNR